MHIKAIASATLLATALGFGSVAYAQTMIGNQTVSEADMERVKTYCEDLQTQANQAAGTTQDQNTTAEVDSKDGDSSKDEGGATVGAVDLDAITLQNCIDGGFIQAAAQ